MRICWSASTCSRLRPWRPRGRLRVVRAATAGAVGFDAQRLDHGGQHLVVTGQEAHLDCSPLVVVLLQGAPLAVGQVLAVVQRLDGVEQRPLPRRPPRPRLVAGARSEEHTSELQSLMRISYAVFCLKKKK